MLNSPKLKRFNLYILIIFDDKVDCILFHCNLVILIICMLGQNILQVGIRPFVLKTQLYSSVKDRTLVDRQLEVSQRHSISFIFF